MPVPNEENDMIIDSGQLPVIVNSLATQFSDVIIELNKINKPDKHKKIARELGEYLDGLLQTFGPYLKGETEGNETGFKKQIPDPLSQIVDNYDIADVAENLPANDPIYCPSLRRWVARPEDCPDYIDRD